MSELTNIFDSFYSRFVLRDFLAKIIPGLILLFALGSAATSTGIIGVYGIMSFGSWLVLLGVAWIAGFVVHSFGMLSKLIKYVPDGVDVKEFSKQEIEFYKRLGMEEQRRYERLAVIKDTCGNTFVALLLLLAIFILDGIADWIASGTAASTSVSFGTLYSLLAFIVVAVGLISLLRKAHLDYVVWQYEYVTQALEAYKPSKSSGKSDG
ncbi:hypothetical protein HYR54_08650 [Candidatus Acetothermia bacterium]|nr:hypothetical protein [Candidatus Acetothermia bacterium]